MLVSPDGALSEGFGWNILLVKDGKVATPDWNVLEGRTRDAVEEICRDEGVPYELRRVEPEELDTADEVFAATTAGGVMPVIRIDSNRSATAHRGRSRACCRSSTGRGARRAGTARVPPTSSLLPSGSGRGSGVAA